MGKIGVSFVSRDPGDSHGREGGGYLTGGWLGGEEGGWDVHSGVFGMGFVRGFGWWYGGGLDGFERYIWCLFWSCAGMVLSSHRDVAKTLNI